MMIAAFLVLAGCCLASGLGMILTKTPTHSALYLVLMFASLGGLFGLLGAPFMAVVQVIIYAGAIMVLFVFLIMTVRPRTGISAERRKAPVRAAVVLAAVLGAELIVAAWDAFGGAAATATAGTPKEIGRLLLTKYLYPFEVTSVLIVAALVGAIALARKREDA
jgi:NADH-quinone oxidoreductase subunit J